MIGTHETDVHFAPDRLRLVDVDDCSVDTRFAAFRLHVASVTVCTARSTVRTADRLQVAFAFQR